jgi:hypothetical protein
MTQFIETLSPAQARRSDEVDRLAKQFTPLTWARCQHMVRDFLGGYIDNIETLRGMIRMTMAEGGQTLRIEKEGWGYAPSSELKIACVTLGVSECDAWSVIEERYKALARINHPDAGGSNLEMQRINCAYDILKREHGKRR